MFVVQQSSSFYVVVRFAESFSILKEMGTGSQASSLIPWCPVTAVFAIGACGCRYPILHLCHSAPTDQQSNFTQACSEGGNADVGRRIYASGKTRSYLTRLEAWCTKGIKNSNKNKVEGDENARDEKALSHFYDSLTVIKAILL